MKPKTILIVLVILVLAPIAYRGSKRWWSDRSQESATSVQGLVDNLRLRLPMRAAPDVLIVQVEHQAQEKVLVYSMRFERLEANNLPPGGAARVKEEMERIVCADGSAVSARKHGLTIRAKGADRTGTPITTAAVLPGGC